MVGGAPNDGHPPLHMGGERRVRMEEATYLSGRGWGRQSNSGGVCRHASMGGGGESEDRREDDSSDCERCTHDTHCYIDRYIASYSCI